jgi:anhydro-N-acetylmuramic acid kinase
MLANPSNSSAQSRIIAGAMSGTSADGVDVALVAIMGHGLGMTARLLHHSTHPYPPALKQAIFTARSGGSIALADLAHLARSISLAYAAAVNAALVQAGLRGADLTAVAAHGQTLFHAPPDTIQWLDPAFLAAEVGCPVVSDFRRADCAAGGQGAPLVPLADYLLFRNAQRSRVLLNLGGIANVTYLGVGCTLDQVIAFDTGPANCIADHLMRMAEPSGAGFDAEGARAARGTVNARLLDALLRAPYFQRPPPKSTDGPDMLCIWNNAVARLTAPGLNDLLATACAWSAAAIHAALAQTNTHPDELLVSGGGTHNQALMNALRKRLGPGVAVTPIDALGIPSAAKEAVAFAMLGAATLDGEPGNVPAATGARRRVVLGSITLKP